MSPTLPTLAMELVESIASYLEHADLRSLRLVCRAINDKALRHCASTLFATVTTDLHARSLQKLQYIAETPHLAPFVEILYIVGHYPNPKSEDDMEWRRSPSGSIALPHIGIRLLQDMLTNELVNCRSSFIDTSDEALFNNDFEEEINLLASDAAAVILHIVARAKLPIKSYIMCAYGDLSALDTDRLLVSQINSDPFRMGWAHLETLTLEFQLTEDQYDWAKSLIVYASKLRSLSIVSSRRYAPFLERIDPQISLSGLEKLTLNGMVVPQSFSQRLILLSHSLSLLKLRDLSIQGDRWIMIFKEMIGTMSKLTSLAVNWLLEEDPPECFGQAFFPGLEGYPKIMGSDIWNKSRLGGPDEEDLNADRTLLKGIQRPVMLTYVKYEEGPELVSGAKYEGPQVDLFLEHLVASTDITPE